MLVVVSKDPKPCLGSAVLAPVPHLSIKHPDGNQLLAFSSGCALIVALPSTCVYLAYQTLFAEATGVYMSIQPSPDDLANRLNAALEMHGKLLKQLETATPEQKPAIQSHIDTVDQEIRRLDGAIRANQPSH